MALDASDIARLGKRAQQQILAELAIRAVKEEAKKPNKYRNKKVESCLEDGTPHTFDSVREFDFYQDLLIRKRAGQISNLRVQVPFELIPKQKRSDGTIERACSYVADFVYDENGKTVVVDTKGVRTKDYKIKRKLMLWIHGISIVEV